MAEAAVRDTRSPATTRNQKGQGPPAHPSLQSQCSPAAPCRASGPQSCGGMVLRL